QPRGAAAHAVARATPAARRGWTVLAVLLDEIALRAQLSVPALREQSAAGVVVDPAVLHDRRRVLALHGAVVAVAQLALRHDDGVGERATARGLDVDAILSLGGIGRRARRVGWAVLHDAMGAAAVQFRAFDEAVFGARAERDEVLVAPRDEGVGAQNPAQVDAAQTRSRTVEAYRRRIGRRRVAGI